ncbi:TetR family transcriptional regulator [Acrocarpospora corrugata]|uniref:TetR family transcriptional regulator n=1 Tax=Acrocarpospora corrugata TaxID=35763 RepID=A0A5M3VZE1_9ACTN|nr:TetR/AcrR family transcriptional regulator [Acrocarpospora corrugata]GES01310.1 TetR family transcriptional regulator [Acrocarpospora corrugata]
MAEPQYRSRRGRQAEAERNDRRVLDAAREVFAAHGAGATVAEIAERAGVGMGSLYRRYGSKSDLLRQLCMQAMEESIQAAEAALAAPDAWTGLSDYVHACVARGSGALAPLAGSLETTPEMWETSRRGRRLLEQLADRAHREGVLRAGVTALDVAWLVEFFGRRGPAAPGTEDEAIRRRLLAISLDGLRNHDAGPLPGPAPSARHYERRWQLEPKPTPGDTQHD